MRCRVLFGAQITPAITRIQQDIICLSTSDTESAASMRARYGRTSSGYQECAGRLTISVTVTPAEICSLPPLLIVVKVALPPDCTYWVPFTLLVVSAVLPPEETF